MCALPIAGRQYQFTSRDQLCGFFHAVATATFPIADSAIFNGGTLVGKSLGWDAFREALMKKDPKSCREMFARDSLTDWRISELWKGTSRITGEPLSILNFGTNLTDHVEDPGLKEQLECLEQATFDDHTLERQKLSRPEVTKPADLILMSNSGYANASLRFTIYDTSPRNEFGKPPIYKQWQRSVRWEIFNPEILELESVQEILNPNWSP